MIPALAQITPGPGMWSNGGGVPHAFTSVGPPPPVQTIAGITLSNNTFTANASPGTVIGRLGVGMSPASPLFSGILTFSTTLGGCNGTNGADNGKFQIVTNNLAVLASSIPSGTYQVCLAATQSGISNSPFGMNFSIVANGSSCTPASRLSFLPRTFSMGVINNGANGSPGDGWTWAHNAGVNENVGFKYIVQASQVTDGEIAGLMNEAKSFHLVPIFSWYLSGSNPYNWQNSGFMHNNSGNTGYFQLWQSFLQQIVSNGNGVAVIDLEPDAYGTAEQIVGSAISMNNFGAIVGTSGYTGVGGFSSLPNTVAGLAQGLLSIRNTYANTIPVGYHTAVWASSNTHNFDAVLAPFPSSAAASASDISTWIHSAGVNFDMIFYDVSDADAGYNSVLCHNSRTLRLWWGINNNGEVGYAGVNNFAAFTQWLVDIHNLTSLPSFLWQIPIGNTVMRTEDNDLNNNFMYACANICLNPPTCTLNSCPAVGGHFQDDRVQYWVQSGNPNIPPLVAAGVQGLLFSGGQFPGLGFCQPGGTNNATTTQIGTWTAGGRGNGSGGPGTPYNPPPIGLSDANAASTFPGNSTNNGVATCIDDDGCFLRTQLTQYFANPQPAVCPR